MTTHDLAKWQEALYGGKVLTPASLAKMTTAYKNSHVNGNRGLGLVVRAPRGGFRWIHHGGSVPGFTSNLAWYRDLNMSVIVLENIETRAPAPDAEDVRDRIVGVMSGKTVPAPLVHSEIKMRAEDLAGFAGTYDLQSGSGQSIVITLEDGQLFQKTTGEGQMKTRIYPEAADRFFIKQTEALFEFVRGQDGHVRSLILHQDGHDIPAPRRAAVGVSPQASVSP